MDYISTLALAQKHGQQHLLKYFDGLTLEQKLSLINDLKNLDFSYLDCLNQKTENKTGEFSTVDALSIADVNKNFDKFYAEGIKALARGEVGAVLLAGGQGTRLGFDGPKGTYNMGETREISIFELQMNNIKQVANACGNPFHVFIMTSDVNDAQTRAFFEEKSYFGYDKDKIHFYVQVKAPTCSFDGKIFLEEKYKISSSPNGNGGWYASLVQSGLDKVVEQNGIRWLNVYAVDNVLQRICNPEFVGATLLGGCTCGAKVVKKACPEERVGVLCKQDGLPTIVEYYELPEEMANARNGDGELTYCYGVILNYLFDVEKLNQIYKEKLPVHLAKKAIPYIENGKKIKPDSPNGYKFETLVVDMIKLMGSCLAIEVEREKEFAPVKNKEGVDSVISARALLKQNGITL